MNLLLLVVSLFCIGFGAWMLFGETWKAVRIGVFAVAWPILVHGPDPVIGTWLMLAAWWATEETWYAARVKFGLARRRR